MIEIAGIRKAFNGVPAVREASFVVNDGEIVALLGQNGAGKSTVMKMIGGVYVPDAGEIRIDGEAVQFRNPGDAERHGVGVVHQELSVVPHLTVAANITLGRESSRLGFRNDGASEDLAREALDRLGSKVSPRALMGSLPVSDQQMCEIARVAAGDVRVVIFDEPTTALSASEKERLFEVMEGMRRSGYAIIFVTHFLEDAMRMSQRCVIMRDGRVVADRATGELTQSDIVRAMIDEKPEELFAREHRQVPGEPLLEVDGLHGGIVEPTSLTIRAGEVVGLAGLLGSGRTELVRLVFGADRAAGGTVRMHGAPYIRRTPNRSVRAGVALISEDRRTDGIALDQSIVENITISALVRGQRGLSRGGFLRDRRLRETAEELRRAVALKCRSVAQRVRYLSGGNQQKVAVARTLAARADILLFDEPTKGVDIGARAEVYRLIDEAAARGAGVVIVSSYNPELLGICDRILVMHRGRLVAEYDHTVTDHELTLAQQGADNVAVN